MVQSYGTPGEVRYISDIHKHSSHVKKIRFFFTDTIHRHASQLYFNSDLLIGTDFTFLGNF